MASALLLGLAACGKDAPLSKPSKPGSATHSCQRLQKRSAECWTELESTFRTALFVQGLKRVKAAPREHRKRLLDESKAALDRRLKAIRKTLVDDFVGHCKRDWQSPKPAHHLLKKRMLECLTQADCKAYARCFASVRSRNR